MPWAVSCTHPLIPLFCLSPGCWTLRASIYLLLVEFLTELPKAAVTKPTLRTETIRSVGEVPYLTLMTLFKRRLSLSWIVTLIKLHYFQVQGHTLTSMSISCLICPQTYALVKVIYSSKNCQYFILSAAKNECTEEILLTETLHLKRWAIAATEGR